MGAEHGYSNSENDQYQEYQGKFAVIAKVMQIGDDAFKENDNPVNKDDRDQGSNGSINNGTQIHWSCDKATRCSNHLHGFNKEAIAIHRELYCIVD